MTSNALSGTVGLVATWLDSDYWLRIVAGATEVLKHKGMTPICFSLGASGTREPRTPHRFFDLVDPQCLSGVIIISTASFQNDTEAFLQRLGGLPAVCVGRWVQGAPSLWVRNAAGIRLLMKHLTEVCGRRRIAFIRGTEKNPEAEARFRAWEDFCVEHSLRHGEELVEQGEFTEPTGETAALKLLEKNSDQLPDALVVSNDRMAVGALRALRAKGLSVPDDVSVVGFDDLEAQGADPPLTTIRQPVFKMGHCAAEALVALLQKESVPNDRMFSPELVIRASCRPGQPAITSDQESSGFGANAFLECAYPSPERLLPLLRTPLSAEQTRSQSKPARGDQVLGELESSLRRAKAREQALIASVRGLRAYAVGRLEQALSQANSLQELHPVMLAHLQLLGLEGLTVAMVHDEAGFQGEARLVVDCTVEDEAPVGPLGVRLPSAQIIAAHAQRTGSTLRIAQPLYYEGGCCGFLLASGALVDNSLLNHLGTVLSRAIMRIGE